MENLHEGHMGIEKTLQRAHTAIFWPGLTNDVKVKISSCPTCIAHQPSQPKEPLKSHEVPSRPWQKLASDLFTWNDKQYLILVDYYSRYFEIDEMTSTTSNAVIKKFCHHFARHGIPEMLISDNAPQYISEEFKRFSQSWDFKHITSSPLYSQSNGLAEKTVQIAKRLLSKAKAESINFERVLLQYRSTPVDNLASPSQLLMGRQIRSTLPSFTNHLVPKTIPPEVVMKRREERQQTQQKYYNKNARLDDNEYTPGQRIQVQLMPKSKWKPGKIIKKDDAPRSYHIDVDGATYRRNKRFIKNDGRNHGNGLMMNDTRNNNHMVNNQRQYINQDHTRPSQSSFDKVKNTDYDETESVMERRSSRRRINPPIKLDL